MAKATRQQTERRVEELLRLRLDGAELWDIREYVREKESEEGSVWHLSPGNQPLSDSQLYRLLAQADERIAESCKMSRRTLIRRHLAVRRNLYAKAVLSGDLRTALACKRDEAELLGLYPPKRQKLEHKSEEDQPISTLVLGSSSPTDEELRDSIRRILSDGAEQPTTFPQLFLDKHVNRLVDAGMLSELNNRNGTHPPC